MAQVNIRIDDNLKEQGERLFKTLGMNLSAAVNIFISQAVREGRIPFEITTRVDPFYSAENQAYLKKAIEDYESGKSKPIVKTMAELEEMAND